MTTVDITTERFTNHSGPYGDSVLRPERPPLSSATFKWPLAEEWFGIDRTRLRRITDKYLNLLLNEAGEDRQLWNQLSDILATIDHNFVAKEERLSGEILKRFFRECPYLSTRLNFTIETGLEPAEAPRPIKINDLSSLRMLIEPRRRRQRTPEEKAAARKQLEQNRRKRAEENRRHAFGGNGGGSSG